MKTVGKIIKCLDCGIATLSTLPTDDCSVCGSKNIETVISGVRIGSSPLWYRREKNVDSFLEKEEAEQFFKEAKKYGTRAKYMGSIIEEYLSSGEDIQSLKLRKVDPTNQMRVCYSRNFGYS